MKPTHLSHAHSVTSEQQPVTKQSTPHNCNYGLPQPFQGFAVTFPRHCPVSGHGVNSLWQSTNAKRSCSYTLYPTPYTLILAFLLTLAPLAHSAWDGTADTTWYTNNKENANFTITTAELLAGLANLINGTESNGTYTMRGKTITLGANIELNDTAGWNNWGSNTSGLEQWTPIGTSSSSFKGTFDGAGHTIRGLYISTSSSYQGLFGYIGSGAVIKNVGVIAGYVSGSSSVGGLAGYTAIVMRRAM